MKRSHLRIGQGDVSGYLLALVTLSIGVVFSALTQPPAPSVAMFLLVVFMGTWLGGTGPGTLTAVLCTAAVAYFLRLQYPAGETMTRVVLFTVLAALMVGVMWSERRAKRALVEDIENRRDIESRLRRSEEELRLVVDTIPAMAWTTHADGRLEFVNHRWLQYAGLSLERALTAVHEVIHPDDVDWALEQWNAALRHVTPFETEMRLRRWDGVYRWFLVRTVPLLAADGQLIRWYGTSTDIHDSKTSRKALAAAAEQRQHLSRRLLESQEQQRQRLARELHDSLGQLLATVTMHLQAAKSMANASVQDNLQRSLTLLQSAGNRIRSLALELRPTMLETSGLHAALRWLAEQHTYPQGPSIEIAGETGEVGSDAAIACYRICQEALTNVARHAHAAHVCIGITRLDGVLKLVVEDDGVGFAADDILDRATANQRLGLVGMRERAELLGGTLAIESGIGRGTRIVACFPAADPESQT